MSALRSHGSMSGRSLITRSARYLFVLLLLGGASGAVAGASAPAVPAARQPDAIQVVGPGAGAKLAAQRLDHRRLTALVDLSGTARPAAQLALAGALRPGRL